jgi:CRP-like cAMP-binding protein
MIPEELLNKFGGIRYNVPKGQYVFHEGDEPFHYFQIISGSVKIVNYNEEGQEFIQGMFSENQSIAEASLLGEFNFPSSGITLQDSRICKLPKSRFFDLLKDHPEIHLKFSVAISRKLHFKAMVGKEMALNNPESQILAIIEFYKKYSSTNNQKKTLIPYTRQQIASMTGLRVETVIRTVKKMQEKGILNLKEHKILA